MNTSSLPLTRNISTSYTLALVIAILVAASSIVGLFFPSIIYPVEVRNSFTSTDVVNLFIVLPVLLGSMALAWKGKIIGLLFWPGSLLIVIYHYLTFALAMPFTWQVLIYLTLVFLSIYTIYIILSSTDETSIKGKLEGKVPERFAGGILAGFGGLFLVWRGALAIQGLTGPAVLFTPEVATAITDVLISPTLILGGVLLWKKQALGYVTGAGLLFQLSMLFIGLLVYFALQPVIADTPFPVNDFVAVFTMSLICFIPFGLFVRGLLLADNRF